MKNAYCSTWNMDRKLKMMENGKHIVGGEIWPEKLQNLKNEKNTPQEKEYGEKTEKLRK